MGQADFRTITSFGVAIDIEGPEVVASEVARLMPDCEVATPMVDTITYTVTACHQGSKLLGYEIHTENGALFTREREPLVAAEKLVDALHFEVACRASGFAFIHAGVVGVDGGALVLPGRSMSGKSTLVSALLRRGASYMSDEYAVVDGDGRVHPYARNLRIRAEDGSGRTTPPTEFTTKIERQTLPLTHIALLRYEAGSDLNVDPLSGASAALALVDNTVRARSNPETTLKASSFAADAVGIQGIRGDKNEAADYLLTWARS